MFTFNFVIISSIYWHVNIKEICYFRNVEYLPHDIGGIAGLSCIKFCLGMRYLALHFSLDSVRDVVRKPGIKERE